MSLAELPEDVLALVTIQLVDGEYTATERIAHGAIPVPRRHFASLLRLVADAMDAAADELGDH